MRVIGLEVKGAEPKKVAPKTEPKQEAKKPAKSSK